MKELLQESTIPWTTWFEGTEQEIRGKALSDQGGKAKIGVGLLELPPGSNTRPSHFHSHEEEHLFVLNGTATLHLGTESFPLEPGSYVCFPAGQPLPHHIENTSKGPFRYLMVGERIEEDTVTHESVS